MGNTVLTQLVDVARAGEFDSVLKLLRDGCNVDVRDDFGSTALIYAVAAHKEEVAKALLEHGADVNLSDDDGRTALFYSVFWGCPVSTVKLLIERGANADIRDRLGNTALMIAAMDPLEEKHKKEIIELLQNTGNKVPVTDEKINLMKNSPRPENVYHFFLCTDVADIPPKDLGCFFDWVGASLSFFKEFKDSDPISSEAEKKLKEILAELYARIESEHVPDLREPVNFILPNKPEWKWLSQLWKVYNVKK